jgi:hypothetical protein
MRWFEELSDFLNEPYDAEMRHAKWGIVILGTAFWLILFSWLIWLAVTHAS